MLTAGIATYRLWLDKGGRLPAVVAGHSLGEYSALVAAGVIDFRDAVPLVRLRAAAMQEAVPVGTGAMAAIMNLDDDRIQEACAEAADEVGNGEVVERVNFNAPGQTVIAGSKAAVERACEGCKARGAKRALLLPVSAPFHSSLIRPAAVKLGARLAELNFAEPKIQVVNNVDVAIESDPARIKDALIRQAFSPVRWVETIQKIASIGITTVAECGPGKVLAGLTKRCSDVYKRQLKASEGLAQMLATFLKREFNRSLLTKLVALIALPVLNNFKKHVDHRRYNGATLLGLKGIVVKSLSLIHI